MAAWRKAFEERERRKKEIGEWRATYDTIKIGSGIARARALKLFTRYRYDKIAGMDFSRGVRGVGTPRKEHSRGARPLLVNIKGAGTRRQQDP